MGMFDFLSSGSKGNAASAGMPYLNQIPQVGEKYLSPYVNQGLQAGQNVQGQYEGMTNDPYAFLQQIMQQYKPSEGYNMKQDQMLKAAGGAAAANGLSGTMGDQQNRAEMVQSLMGSDMQDFINQIMGIYGTGLQGQQHTADQGYGASGQMADYLGSNLGQQAGMAYGGKQSSLNNQSGLFNSLLGAGTQGYGAYQGAQSFNPLIKNR